MKSVAQWLACSMCSINGGYGSGSEAEAGHSKDQGPDGEKVMMGHARTSGRKRQAGRGPSDVCGGHHHASLPPGKAIAASGPRELGKLSRAPCPPAGFRTLPGQRTPTPFNLHARMCWTKALHLGPYAIPRAERGGSLGDPERQPRPRARPEPPPGGGGSMEMGLPFSSVARNPNPPPALPAWVGPEWGQMVWRMAAFC